MTERRYSDDEVAAIFARTTEARPTKPGQPVASRGLTLSELQEIGREVGIAPDEVARAAKSLDQTSLPLAKTFLGLPIGVGRTVELGRMVSDEEWERFVVELRDTFEARGSLGSSGSLRHWSNGNLQVLLEPTAHGHRLRMRTTKGSARSLMTAGLALLGLAGAATVAGYATGGALGSGVIENVGVMAMMGLGALGAGALQVPSWARLRRRQMDELADRLAPASLPPGSAAPTDPT